MQGEKESLTLLYYPPEGAGQEPVTVIELGPSTNACPQGLCMYNIRTKVQDALLVSVHYNCMKSSYKVKSKKSRHFVCDVS